MTTPPDHSPDDGSELLPPDDLGSLVRDWQRRAQPVQEVGGLVERLRYSALCAQPGEKLRAIQDEAADTITRQQAEIERLQRQITGYQHHLWECAQIAGKALGYPWFKNDQKNFPGATEADGVCIGEHLADTIVQELAERLQASTGRGEPVAWRVKDFADGWILCHTPQQARRESKACGNRVEPLYLILQAVTTPPRGVEEKLTDVFERPFDDGYDPRLQVAKVITRAEAEAILEHRGDLIAALSPPAEEF